MNIFQLLTPVSYWLLVGMWMFILHFYLLRLFKKKFEDKLFYSLIMILAIDAFRTLFESLYFGAWYTSLAGFLPISVHDFLVRPENVFIPKFINVLAALMVITILLRRYIPGEEEYKKSQKEYSIQLEKEIAERKQAENALIQINEELENRVNHRTAELKEKNDQLRNEIEQRKKTEEQLIQSGKMASIGVLVSGIAHEINNPNYFVSFNIPILRDYLNEVMPIVDEYANNHPDIEMCNMPYTEFREDIFKLLDNVEQGSHRIKTIVSDLKEFSRVNKEKKTKKIHIKEVIKKVVPFTRNNIKKTVKTFKVHIPEDLPEIQIEVQPLEQVLINLLINAAQSFGTPGDENSRVDLTISDSDMKDENLVIEVKDNGCGMDEETLGKIFDPFFTTKTSEEGTGLGMYISHNLIANMGGKIEVESTLGEGSAFRVILTDQQSVQHTATCHP